MKQILKPLNKDLQDKYDKDSLVYISDEEFHYNSKVPKNLLKDIKERTFQTYTGYYEFKKGWDSPKLYLIGRGINSKKQTMKVEGFYPFCLSGDHDVLTEDGWINIKDYVGQRMKLKVATLNPKTNKVEYHYPSEHIKYKYRGKIIEQNGNVSYKVTPNHKMWVRVPKTNPNEFSLVDANKMGKWTEFDRTFNYENSGIKNIIIPKIITEINQVRHKHGNLHCTCDYDKPIDITYTQGNKNNDIKINANLFIEFLGYYLSEGWLSKHSNGNYYTMFLRQVNEESKKIIWKCIEKLPFDIKYYKDNTLATIHSKQLTSYLEKFGHNSWTKHLTPDIKSLSKHQLQILLQSLFVGDGYIRNGELKQFGTVSKQLADDVQEIAMKCGYNATLNKRNADGVYIITLSDERFLTPVSQPSKKQIKDYDNFVYCIQVPNHIFMTRRSGKPMWIGNCYIHNKDGNYKSYKREQLEKIYFKGQKPKQIAYFRQKMERIDLSKQPKEADVPYVRNFLRCTSDFFKPKELIMPRVGIFDVETDYPDDEDKVISFAINATDGSELYFSSIQLAGSFDELMLDMLEKMKEYDVITFWSGRDNNKFRKTKTFDMEKAYIGFKRLKKNKQLDIDPNPLHYVADVDSLELAKKMYSKVPKGGWSLDNIGIRLCGIGKAKEDSNLPPSQLKHDDLVVYNCVDTIIPAEIDNKLGGIACHLQLMHMLGCKLSDTEITEVINDISILKVYHKAGIVLDSKRPYWERERIKKLMKDLGIDYRYKAAEPTARGGVYNKLAKIDLSAAYPSSVLAIKASVETLDPNGKYLTPGELKVADLEKGCMDTPETRFSDGFSPFIDELQRLMEERYKVKRQLPELNKTSNEYKTLKYIDFALKTQVAAYSHGIFGFLGSRMDMPVVAAAICSTARTFLDIGKYFTDRWGYKWCYTHTDSCFFVGASKRKAKEICNKLNEKLKIFAEQNGLAFCPEFDFEGYFPLAYIHSPARNVLVDEDGEWHVTGCNFMRAEVPEPLAKIEEDLIKMKLARKSDLQMIKKLRKMIIELGDMPSSKLGLEKPLNGTIESYGRELKDGSIGGYPSHIKALIKAKEEYGLELDGLGRFKIIPIFTGEVEGVRVLRWRRDVIAFPIDGELPKQYKIDYEEYLRSNLYGKIHDLFGVTANELEDIVMTTKVKEALGIQDPPKNKDNNKNKK